MEPERGKRNRHSFDIHTKTENVPNNCNKPRNIELKQILSNEKALTFLE